VLIRAIKKVKLFIDRFVGRIPVPLSLIGSLCFTILLIGGILYEPTLPPLYHSAKNKIKSSKSNIVFIKDKVPLKVASSLRKGLGKAFLEKGDEDTYEVVGGDTLMLIAFKLFGDYTFWKKLAKWNESFLDLKNEIDIGMKLRFFSANQKSFWPPDGSPYLIKKGDFLTKISKKIYGNSQGWVSLFKKNRLMIKNPDLIFAGFTLFYNKVRD
jgi:hypothetical protein